VKASRVVMKVIIYINYNDAEYFKFKLPLTELKEFFLFSYLASMVLLSSFCTLVNKSKLSSVY
jgi:hypothetical protein